MSKLNQRIREFLEDTSQDHRSKNCFAWGKLRIQLDPDSPIKGVEFQEYVRVSIYHPDTDTMLQFSVPVEAVQIEENALSEFKPDKPTNEPLLPHKRKRQTLLGKSRKRAA